MDDYLKEMKEGLSASAVLKTEFVMMKSACSIKRIFAYEGPTDKIIYFCWLDKHSPDLEYEPFVCSNKDQLLKLFDSLNEDLTGLNENVYFFVDRDFDDLRGRTVGDSVYLTDQYAIENYVVTSRVLESLLKIELHCHGNDDIRAEVLNLFNAVYLEFLEVTTPLNFRIFLSRRAGIKQLGDLPDRIGKIANVTLLNVTASMYTAEELVILEREPSEEEVIRFAPDFAALDKQKRFRGKFALMFFAKWLSLLMIDRNSANSILFRNVMQSKLVAKGPFGFSVLASKTRPPEEYKIFVNAIA